MKKYFLLVIACITFAGCSVASSQPSYHLLTDTLQSKEYSFELRSQNDTSATVRAEIQKNPTSLIHNHQPIATEDTGEYSKSSESLNYSDILTVGTKQYSLQLVDKNTDTYAVYDGSTKVFEHRMCLPNTEVYGYPMLFSIHGKLGVQFFECAENKQPDSEFTLGDYTSAIYYDGTLISQTYNVTNTTFIFGWKNKIGFIADHDNATYVYVDGKVISDGFEYINTKNCCALFEATPTLYDNGVLSIYGHKGGQYVIAELRLE